MSCLIKPFPISRGMCEIQECEAIGATVRKNGLSSSSAPDR